MAQRNEMQMNLEIIARARTHVSVAACLAFCTNMGWKELGKDPEDRGTVFVSLPHPNALLGLLGKFVARMQPLM